MKIAYFLKEEINFLLYFNYCYWNRSIVQYILYYWKLYTLNFKTKQKILFSHTHIHTYARIYAHTHFWNLKLIFEKLLKTNFLLKSFLVKYLIGLIEIFIFNKLYYLIFLYNYFLVILLSTKFLEIMIRRTGFFGCNDWSA